MIFVLSHDLVKMYSCIEIHNILCAIVCVIDHDLHLELCARFLVGYS